MLEILLNNTIQHLGYIFTFLALSIKDVLWLRVVLVIAQLTLGTYQLISNRYDVMLWNFVFTCVNIFHIIKIINERKPVKIPIEIIDLYKKIFYNMTTKEFLYFWNLGQYSIDKNKRIIKEGEKQKHLFMILNGSVSVSHHSKLVGNLSRGDFIAEMSLITEEPASADDYIKDEVKYIIWNQNQLRHFQNSNPDFWVKLNNILSRDLIKKIKS